MQTVFALIQGGLRTLELPDPAIEALPGLEWGRHDELLTPAYWAGQAWMWAEERPDHFRLGRSLEEETLACLLGGHGIPAEVGLAAYERLRACYAANPESLEQEDVVLQALAEPLAVNGRSVRYRFARQKAHYIGAAFRHLRDIDRSLSERGLRDRLTTLPGVGPKTASWIVRNWQGSDDVAILDVHILRAGRLLDIFEPHMVPERHYYALEERFLSFADAIGARASVLDSVMWMIMRRLPRTIVFPRAVPPPSPSLRAA